MCAAGMCKRDQSLRFQADQAVTITRPTESSEAFIKVAMIHLMVRRLRH